MLRGHSEVNQKNVEYEDDIKTQVIIFNCSVSMRHSNCAVFSDHFCTLTHNFKALVKFLLYKNIKYNSNISYTPVFWSSLYAKVGIPTSHLTVMFSIKLYGLLSNCVSTWWYTAWIFPRIVGSRDIRVIISVEDCGNSM